MATLRSSVLGHLDKLWQEHGPDYDAFNVAAIGYLKARYSGKLQSSRLLFGREIQKMMNAADVLTEHEVFFGSLLAITPGVVLLRASDFWREYTGMLLRDTPTDTYLPKFHVRPIVNPHVRVQLTQDADGPVTILHSDEDGMSYAQISVQRWAEMNPWLDTWLPAE